MLQPNLQIKTRTIVLWSIPFFILHAAEEVVTLFYLSDVWILTISELVSVQPLVVFIAIQITLGILIVFLLTIQGLVQRLLKVVLGLVFVVELTHIVDVIQVGAYTPGLYSSIALLIIGGLYWMSLLTQD